jgi:hypothetical protein
MWTAICVMPESVDEIRAAERIGSLVSPGESSGSRLGFGGRCCPTLERQQVVSDSTLC